MSLRHSTAFLALALGAAACGSSVSTVGARFDGPTAIVPLIGRTVKNAGVLHDYLAVASTRGDELSFLDPGDDNPVLGPGAVFPLVIPTAPSPLLLAAASLGDQDSLGNPTGADLLVAVSAGARSLQLVNTWDPTANRVVAEVDLSATLQGGIVAVAATTVTGAIPAQAQVIAAAAGGQLAVVTFSRLADGSGGIAADPFDAATSSRTLAFEPVSLAVEPALPSGPALPTARLFIATPDPILPPATTLGVAQLTMTGALPAWPLAALDARAGTTLVAAARVRELDLSKGPTDPKGREIFVAAGIDPTLRVYAALDPRTCGVAGRINCGLAALDPDATTPGLAADPASTGALLDRLPLPAGVAPPPAVPPQKYRAPVPIPGGAISAIGFAFAAAHTSPQVPGPARDETDPLNLHVPQFTTTSAVRVRKTTAVAAVSSSDGRNYLVDLGRFGLLEDALPLGVFPALVSQAQTVAVSGAAAAAPLLGLHSDFPTIAAPDVSTDPAALPLLFQVTPGFTPSDTWNVTWRGALPALLNRRGILFESGGGVFLAAQSPAASGTTAVDVAVGAPELGVHPNSGHADRDSAVVICPDGSPAPETLVQAVIAPAALPSDPVPTAGAVAVPGGALQLAGPVCSLATGGTLSVTFTVRASGFVLTSNALGYAGRPLLDTPFSFQWQDEDAAGLQPEDLALARKARRHHYTAEAACLTAAGVPPSTGCYSTLPGLLDPMAPGPVIAFELGLAPSTALLADLPTDTKISFTTFAGLTPVVRRPISAGLLPQGITPFDVSKFAGRENEPVRFYTTYSDNQVLVFTPAGSSGDVKSIR